MPKGKLPKWAWVAAVGVALVVAYFVLHKSSTPTDGISPDQPQPQPSDAGGGGGGGGGLGSGTPSPIEPVSAPTPVSVAVGGVVTTLQDPGLQMQQSAFAPPQLAPLAQEGTPYATAPPLPSFDVTKTVLPKFDPTQTTLPAFHLQTLPTPSLASSTPSTYGGVLSPERA